MPDRLSKAGYMDQLVKEPLDDPSLCYQHPVRRCLAGPRSQSGPPSSNAVSASFRVVTTRKLKSVGETSPLPQLTLGHGALREWLV